MNEYYSCPCCGYLTLSEPPPGTFEICEVCNWEDDEVQYNNVDYEGGANEKSLRQAKEDFKKNNETNKYMICLNRRHSYKKSVVEIFFEKAQWAEINQEKGVLEVEFYKSPDGQPWKIDYCDVINALADAKQKLTKNT